MLNLFNFFCFLTWQSRPFALFASYHIESSFYLTLHSKEGLCPSLPAIWLGLDLFAECSSKYKYKLFKITVSRKYGWKINIHVICVSFHNITPVTSIHLHAIGLTGATELGTVTCHFAPNQRRFQWSIFWWILLRRNNIFLLFSTLSKHHITILVIISPRNRSLTSYLLSNTWWLMTMMTWWLCALVWAGYEQGCLTV